MLKLDKYLSLTGSFCLKQPCQYLKGDFRRGSWRPIGHMRPSSPLLDSLRDLFEGYDQLTKDFSRCFCNADQNNNKMLFDICFIVGQGKEKSKLYGVRAILAVRSR